MASEAWINQKQSNPHYQEQRLAPDHWAFHHFLGQIPTPAPGG